MSIKSIKIKNLLSFDELIIDKFEDINCIVGKNNAGKSNLLKLLRFFYKKLEGIRELPPELNSQYSAFGSITIIYTISHRIKQDLKRRGQGNLFDGDKDLTISFIDLTSIGKDTTYELSLKIYSNDSIEWSEKNHKVLNTINYLYPFFDIEARYIDLHNWDKLWYIVSRLKSFNLKDLEKSFTSSEKENNARKEYDRYINNIKENIETSKYTYQEKVLAFIKMGLTGDKFLISENDLDKQSDGTNAHKFIELSLKLLISLTRREYITPIIYVDEPEIGLHPKKNEELIENIYDIYSQGKDTTKTPYPTIIFATHSPNIVKQVIKFFDKNQQILHFSKYDNKPTIMQKMNSQYDDKRFLNVFSDNEARLFFSNFILFVEGATEVEIFRNKKLNRSFEKLNKIDVYEAKESMLKYINPAYSNTAIPYLVLYDADKFIDINIDENKIKFKKDVINLVTYYKKYQKSYLYSNQRKIYNVVKYLLDNEKITKLEFENNINILSFNYSKLIKDINVLFLNEENFFINKTTIEECLINIDNFSLFRKWFFMEFKNLIGQDYNEKTPKSVIQNNLRYRVKELKKFKKYIDTNFNSKEELRIAIILIFGGKTETSISLSTDNHIKLSEDFRNKIEILKVKYIQKKQSLNMGHLIGKTSGWATSFLNFAIDEIENTRGNKEFREEFEIYFGELYDIITLIENKI